MALARLSAKYNIPIAVPTCTRKSELERYIPNYLPKYFKKKQPLTIVINENVRGRRYKALLMEDGLSYEQIEAVEHLCNGVVVGYRKYD